MYDKLSKRAAEFIDHDEIERTMAYARENRHESALIGAILDKAEAAGGLTHREAALLLECADEALNERIYALARRIKERIYGNRIVLFAPLYLSNFCVNGCTYCPYHAANRTMLRRQLTQEQIEHEVVALQDMGHKRLALEAGEHPLNSIDYILESIRTIYGIRHRNGAIRRVNVNIAATTVENYRRLADAGIGTYILFQETYHSENYRRLHPYGPKSDYSWHTEAMDRAMEGGIDDVGIGVLFGLSNYLYDFTGLMMHAEHLEAACGVGPHTISVPRICPARRHRPRCVRRRAARRAVPQNRGRHPHRRALYGHDYLDARIARHAPRGAPSGHLADQRRLQHLRRRLRRLRPRRRGHGAVRRERPPYPRPGRGMAARPGLRSEFLHGLLPGSAARATGSCRSSNRDASPTAAVPTPC